MADGGEIAELFATLGLRVNQGQWAQGNAAVQGARRAVAGLDGAFADAQGRWRVASGRFLTMGEKMAAGLGGVAPAARQAGAAAHQAGASAEHAGGQAAHGWDAAATAIKGYLLYLGGHFGYEHLIKFNQEMQDNTISLAAMIEGQLGGSFQEATGKAKELYGEWQKFSTQTPVTTAEIVEFGKNIAAATFGAKGTIKDLTQLTEQGVIAAKVLAGNRNAGYAALEISEMLSGNVSNRMMFVKQLLGMIHMTEEQFRGLDDKGRLAAVKKALGSDAFKDAAKAFGASFSGVTSTLWDKIQIALGKIGLPIFERIIAAVTRLNEWLDRNSTTIARVSGAISDGLTVAWDLVVAVWNKAYAVFENNREVIGRIADKVGADLWTAFQAFVIVLDQAIDGVDRLLKFFDHGFGKFLLDALLMPNLLTIIANLLDRIGVSMDKIKQIASFNIFGKAFDLISGGGDDELDGIDHVVQGKPNTRKPLPGVNLRDALSRRAQELETDASEAGTQDERDQLIERSLRLRDMIPTAPALPAGNAGPVAMNISVGDINVHSPNADPVAVGDQVRKVFHEELGNTIRKATDVYG